jgi:hypothetical protein
MLLVFIHNVSSLDFLIHTLVKHGIHCPCARVSSSEIAEYNAYFFKKTIGWCLRKGCLGEYLDLRGMK